MISALGPAFLLRGQAPPPISNVNLASPSLQGNASLAVFNTGPQLSTWMSGARAKAAANGIAWTGLNVVGFEGLPSAAPGMSVSGIYQQRVCQVDLVAVGHPNASVSHLSASKTTVYADYDFKIDNLLKDNRIAPVGSAPDIVVTRIGGSLSLPEGKLRFNSEEFPQLQPNTTYLQLLHYIPTTSSYFARDGFSTLVLVGNNWAIDRKSYASVTIPGFTRGTLESSIAAWMALCPK